MLANNFANNYVVRDIEERDRVNNVVTPVSVRTIAHVYFSSRRVSRRECTCALDRREQDRNCNFPCADETLRFPFIQEVGRPELDI